MESMTIKLVFVMALFMATSQADFHMTLEPEQREISLQMGETFQFLCEAFDCPNPTFNWGTLMDKTLSGTVNTEGSRSTLTMQVSYESEGTYRCKVFCNQHKQEKYFKISVYSLPSDPILHISSLVAEVQSSIICTVHLVFPSEMLSLRLLKDSEEVVAEYGSLSVEIYQDLRNVSLSYDWIPHVEDDGSVILCEAEISFVDEGIKPITRATNAILSVAYPPSNPNITVLPSKSVRAGENISLGCLAESHTQATVRWVKESANVALPSENGNLEITGVQPQDSGKYICYVENEAGRNSASVVITVQGVPIEPEISILPATTVIQGQAVTIECVGHRDSDTQVTLWKETLMLSTDGIAHIERADPMDTAMYKCKASNQYGDTEAMEFLTVQFPPKNTRLTITPSELVKEGDQVIIQCISEAFPAPTLILETEYGQVELEATNGKHIIISATVEHSGTYTCKSINSVGKEVAELSLIVQGPPQNTTILVKPSKNVTEGDTVTITCETQSTPFPTILLKKMCPGNSTIQQAENGTFILPNVTRNDTGTYVVSIINEAGNKTEVIEINVQARYQSPQNRFAIPIIATSLCAVAAVVIGLIVYHMKQAQLQGSYSLVKALRSRV
ncbi:vascular cell adhesion protein 1 [Xenopus laevis]|uniref:Vascular cell adhesion protein 1 n=1 Tax=Xenopus laevis TaxID=8355 RepID=A0A8J0V352_XENLA|nr:vascular cell adhesion protein 1 [Xenopus laevis]